MTDKVETVEADSVSQGTEPPKFTLNPFVWLKGLYHWVLKWADHRHNEKVLAAVSFTEASFFLVPPDVLLLAMGAANPKKSLRYAGIASIFSVLGGLFGYFLGFMFWQALQGIFIPTIFSQAKFDFVLNYFHNYGFWVMFIASFTPIPFKVFTLAGGVVQLPLGLFFVAIVIGRSTRYFIVGGLMYFFGETMKGFVEKYFDLLTVGFTLLLLLGLGGYYYMA